MSVFICCFLLVYLVALLLQFYCLKFRSAKALFNYLHAVKCPTDKDSDNFIPISIVICAKNERQNLSENLPYILQQNYPSGKWEVVVVNDASTDETGKLLKILQIQFPQLKTVTINSSEKRNLPGKKFALQKGIEAASFETVLLTDADCKPASNKWLLLFSKTRMQSRKPIVLGYGAYEKSSSFLNKLIQWETLQTSIQYCGMNLSGHTYMGVGRNLMYDKSLYLKAFQDEEFKNKYALTPSGDDDLLIAKIASPENTTLCLEKNAQTISSSVTSYRQWIRQKERHFGTGKYYQKSIKNILGIAALSLGIFWLTWIILWIFLAQSIIYYTNLPKAAIYSICFLAGIFRILLYWSNAKKWYSVLDAEKIIISYPLGEISISLLYLILSPYIFWKNKKEWK